MTLENELLGKEEEDKMCIGIPTLIAENTPISLRRLAWLVMGFECVWDASVWFCGPFIVHGCWPSTLNSWRFSGDAPSSSWHKCADAAAACNAAATGNAAAI